MQIDGTMPTKNDTVSKSEWSDLLCVKTKRDNMPEENKKDILTCDDIKKLCTALSWLGYSTPSISEACATETALVRTLIDVVLELKERKQKESKFPRFMTINHDT